MKVTFSLKMRGKVSKSECPTPHYNFPIVQCNSYVWRLHKENFLKNCTCLDSSDLATEETIGKARPRQLENDQNITLDDTLDKETAGDVM